MNDLFEKLKNTSWTTVLKSLPFNAGASSTRWVFMNTFLVLSIAYLMVVGSVCWVYIRDSSHPIGAGTTTLLLGMAAALSVFPTNTQNVRHQLNAQVQTDKPLDASSTPITSSVGLKDSNIPEVK